MSEDTPESELDRHKAEAARLLEEIRKLRADSEAELLAAAQKRKEADEHATYAYQAKVNTEKHAKDVSVLKGQADGDASTLAAAKKNFDELIAAATLAKVTLEADTKAASEKRRAFEQSLEATESALVSSREKAQQIEKTKVDIDSLANAIQKLREEATQAQAKAVQASGKTDEERAKAADHAAQSAELLKQLTVTRTKGSEEAAQIKAALEATVAERTKIAAVIKHLEESDAIARGHEKRVEDLETKLTELNDKAEKLLPGATSAGLASSFLKQKERFGAPQRRWLWTFMTCIALLILVAAPSYWAAVSGTDTTLNWDRIFLSMAMRLPIVIPLVWLAIYAGRNYMLSVRLEEDYAFKEAISMAFEGYKREMDKIGAGDLNNPTPLTKLCLNVLSALAERPGRIYEGHSKDITLTNAAKDALQSEQLRQKIVAPIT